ncbi:MAG TPA: hypothetical protein VHE30_16000 [Polyangiaceae bacterium]|nr:hypothetical protein [Polyangiaceae bacterium]
MFVNPEAVLAAALTLATYVGDRTDTPEERAALYRPVAEAIAEASRTNAEAAMLVSLAFHETNLARFVIEGRCKDGPPGQRCDGGKARGVFQLHRSACPDAWRLPDGSAESIRAEASCAIKLLRWNGKRGKGRAPSFAHAAYAGYGARDWSWDGADKRVETARKLEQKIASHRPPKKKPDEVADVR